MACDFRKHAFHGVPPRHARNLFLAGALLGISALGARAENTANLLVNPGAETGDLTGWTLLPGSGTAHADNGAFDPGILPQSGSWDFVGGAGASATLSQECILSGIMIPFELIDAGAVLFNVSFYEQSLFQTPTDTAGVGIQNLDVNSALISGTGEIPAPVTGAWQNTSFDEGAPAGTRGVVYNMTFVRNSGRDLDAFIDSNSLTASYNGSAWNSSAGDHLWNSPANWDSGVPLAGAAAVLTSTSGPETVKFNGNYASPLSSLFVDALGGITLNQSANTMNATLEYVGNSATGAYTQSGGSNVTGTLNLGSYTGSYGAYTLTGGSLVTSFIYVAYTAGSGTFNISGGSAVAPGALALGTAGTLNLSGGTLTIPALSTPTPNSFNWTGGLLNITTDAFYVDARMAPNAVILNGSESANFTGAESFTAGGVGGANAALIIGLNPIIGNTSGTFTQDGTGAITVGTAAAPRNVDLAPLAGSAATYTLSNPATSLVVHGEMSVGGTESGSTGGSANFDLLAGSATIDTLNINPGGSLTLAGGTLTAGSLGGFGGPNFTWTAGTLNITAGGLAVGFVEFPSTIILSGSQSGNFTGATTFTFNGVSGANAALIVGFGSDASFLQEGTGQITIGTAAAPRNLDLATDPGFSAYYFLVNPATSLTVHGHMYVGGCESGPTGGSAEFRIQQGSAAIDTLSILSDGVLDLAGGTLGVGILDATAHPTGFQWTGGNLTLLDGSIYGLSSITVPPMSTLSGSGSIVADIQLLGNITVANQADDLEIHGLLSGPGNISVAADAYFTADSLLVNSLTVGGIARIRPGGANPVALNSLVIAGSAGHWTGTLDITDNPLIVEASSAADKTSKLAILASEVQSGASAGAWTGTGITSSTVADDVLTATTHTYHTVVAIVDNGAYPPGTAFTSFAGQLVDANSIIISRALAGDANLDGTVNNTDLVALLTHYGLSGQTQATGDFNGDSTVNNTDLVALLTDYGQSLPASFSLIPDATNSSVQATAAAVPEPASLAMLAIAAPLLLRRRRTANPKIQSKVLSLES